MVAISIRRLVPVSAFRVRSSWPDEVVMDGHNSSSYSRYVAMDGLILLCACAILPTPGRYRGVY